MRSYRPVPHPKGISGTSQAGNATASNSIPPEHTCKCMNGRESEIRYSAIPLGKARESDYTGLWRKQMGFQFFLESCYTCT